MVNRLSKLNQNLVISPIIDPVVTKTTYFRSSLFRATEKYTKGVFRWGPYDFVRSSKYFKIIFTRSQFESEYISRAYGIPKSKLRVVPLSYSTTCQPYTPIEKENFCLHISSIYQDRKNVVNLIRAAKKYKFHLVLAGNKGSDVQYKPIKEAIGDATNIDVLGFISEEKKIDLYKRAKVFALPSKSEGVGIVAVDAAYYGCEIVITNIEGPKEYYNKQCIEVNPYSVDEIGSAVVNFMDGAISYQPNLSLIVKENFSMREIGQKLMSCYNSIS